MKAGQTDKQTNRKTDKHIKFIGATVSKTVSVMIELYKL